MSPLKDLTRPIERRHELECHGIRHRPFLYRFCDEESEDVPTDQNVADLPGERYPSRDAAVIAAFEEDLARRTG